MQQYLDSLEFILENGVQQPNRTGDPAITFPGYSMRFNVSKTFPAMTTKKLFWWSMVGELCALLRGATNAAEFRALRCNIWDQNANGEGLPGHRNAWLDNPFRKDTDDLGKIYGAQWRRWQGFKKLTPDMPLLNHLDQTGWTQIANVFDEHGWDESIYHKEIDQIRNCVEKLLFEPQNRRILFHAWNPAELDEMSLPSCHLLYQFLPNIAKKELSLCLYIR